MSWEEAVKAAGLAVNHETSMDDAALRQSVSTAKLAAERVLPAQVRGKYVGRYSGLRVAKFQQSLYGKNVEWRFTDRTLCVFITCSATHGTCSRKKTRSPMWTR